jgi:hypothetical protein
MERRDIPSHDDNSVTTAIADGFQAAVYTGLQQPYNAIRQIAGQVHIDLPDAHMASAPADAKTGSMSWFAESAGSAAGMIPWVIASNKLVRAGSSFAGLSREGAALTASGMGMGEAGMTGAVYSTLFQPAQGNGNFFANKAADAGIAFGTFAAGAGANNVIRPMFGNFGSELANRAVTAGTASLSAFGAGVVNAESSNLLGKPQQDALQTGLKFALIGGVFGATSRGVSSESNASAGSLASRNGFQTKAEAMSRNLSQNGDPLVASPLGAETSQTGSYFERPAGQQPTGGMFGPHPNVIESTIGDIKARYGENSPELASTMTQLGDAHMTQGKLSAPQAEASYQEALRIYSSHGSDTPQTAWVLDKLASVNQSAGDTVGAAANLSKALEIWRSMPNGKGVPNESHIARRAEDLARLQLLTKYNTRTPIETE